MRLAIPADIVQRYFPESEIVYDYGSQSYVLETVDGYAIPCVEMRAFAPTWIGAPLEEWPEVQ